MNCWICGDFADSEEHKFKSSDLRKHYGKKYNNGNEMLYFTGNKAIEVDSYKSKELKFPKVICTNCNNNRTKAHDDAYDIFINYMPNRFEQLHQNKVIDFYDIYGSPWQEQKRNLYRYYVKHAGCKIVTGQYPYDLDEMSRFILGQDKISSFLVHFQIKEGIKVLLDMPQDVGKNRKYAHLFNSDTICFSNVGESLNYAGWISNQWLSTNWVVGNAINPVKFIAFDERYEIIEIKCINDCDPFTSEMSSIGEVIEKIEYQGVKDRYNRVRFFAGLMGT